MLNQIILGIIQGIFEWLPISSEGITALASQFLIKDINPIDIALFLHLGTLVAVLLYFKKDWKQIITIKNKPLVKFLIIATIISLAVGFPLYNLIRNFTMGNILLLVMGTGLIITAFFHKSKKSLSLNLTKLAIISGILQGLAVIPGLSRSGSTIFGLSLGKLSPNQILKYSYILSVPVVLASTIYITIRNPVLLSAWPALISSFILGFLTLKFLMNLSRKINFFKFTLIFGILCYIGAFLSFIFL